VFFTLIQTDASSKMNATVLWKADCEDCGKQIMNACLPSVENADPEMNIFMAGLP
jgi:hypothetical protein